MKFGNGLRTIILCFIVINTILYVVKQNSNCQSNDLLIDNYSIKEKNQVQEISEISRYDDNIDIETKRLEIINDSNIAIIGLKNGHIIISNISDPSQPIILSELDLGSIHILEFLLDGNFLYVPLSNLGFKIIDVSDLLNPFIIGSYYSYCVFYKILVDGNSAYLLSVELGIEILDITDKSKPFRTNLYANSDLLGMRKFENTLFVSTSDKRILVLNITNPNNIQILDEIANVEKLEIYFVNENYLYVANESYILVYNYSDPTNLTIENQILKEQKFYEIIQNGNYFYIRQKEQISIYNVTESLNPVKIADYFLNISYVNDMAVSKNSVFVLSNFGFIIEINVFDKANPIFTNSIIFGGLAVDIIIIGNLLFIVESFSGLEIIDITDIYNPLEIGHFHYCGNILSFFIKNDIAFIGTMSDGLLLVNISIPTNPTFIKRYYSEYTYSKLVPNNENYAIISWSNGFEIVDISDVYNLFNISFLSLSSFLSWELYVNNKTAFITKDTSLMVPVTYMIDISDIYNPVLRPNYLMGVVTYLKDKYAFSSFSFIPSGLVVYDISNLTNPIIVADADGFDNSVVRNIIINSAYLARGDVGLSIADITNLNNFIEIMKFSNSFVQNLKIHENYGFIAAGIDGLVIIDLDNNNNGQLDSNEDNDNDGLCNLLEEIIGTNPDNIDTDGDSFTDYQEYLNGTDPTDPNDPPKTRVISSQSTMLSIYSIAILAIIFNAIKRKSN